MRAGLLAALTLAPKSGECDSLRMPQAAFAPASDIPSVLLKLQARPGSGSRSQLRLLLLCCQLDV